LKQSAESRLAGAGNSLLPVPSDSQPLPLTTAHLSGELHKILLATRPTHQTKVILANVPLTFEV